ncbi:MAG: membrane protein insertase YidC [Sphaerochaeta sp.]|nr:membrane protein insertase YidC [Sphaerochaeta sp.]
MGALLYNTIIYPLELLVEFIFTFFYKGFSSFGLAIVGVSIAINVLALPLYLIADKLQKTERDKRMKLQPGITRIKSTFKGDEQFMLLSTYYRQNHYHPMYVLRSSVSLLIQIPFFIAAFHFLSNFELLQGVGFLFIKDLGKPDNLLVVNGIGINLLPIVMTFINVVAGAIYTKGFPLREKVQLYAMALLFLALLYTSPAGLVLYWTLNNIFSLVKNSLQKLKHVKQVVSIGFASFGVLAGSMFMYLNPGMTNTKRLIIVLGCLVLIFSLQVLRLIDYIHVQYLASWAENKKRRKTIFFLSCTFLWLLCGLVIPSNLIASSPIEFSFLGSVDNPLDLIFYSLVVFFGIFCAWPVVIYGLFSDKVKTLFTILLVGFSVSSLLNVFVFSGNYSVVNSFIQFDNTGFLIPSAALSYGSLAAGIGSFGIILLLFKNDRTKIVSGALTVLVLASLASGVYNMGITHSSFKKHQGNLVENQKNTIHADDMRPIVDLSKEGNNVVFIFLDRALSAYFPYIMNQSPKLMDQYQGFVYYPNTVSFGAHTTTGAPAMLGGYEYTPDNMEARGTKLIDVHNESLLVLPKIFLDAGYSVTVTDPPFSNYVWSGDLSPFRPYPEIRAMNVLGNYTLPFRTEHSSGDDDFSDSSVITKKYLPIFSIFKLAPPSMRVIIYDEGKYFSMKHSYNDDEGFLDSYTELYYLSKLTETKAKGNTFSIITNETPHSPRLLQAPEYEHVSVVTNSKTPFSGLTEKQTGSYHVNAASIKRIGLWLEELKRMGVYDNTRIILVADHGYELETPVFDDFSQNNSLYSQFNPLLLVKDFRAVGDYVTDPTFMTNADAPILAIEGLGVSTLNPFTKKDLIQEVDKSLVHAYKADWMPNPKNTKFDKNYTMSFTVHDNIFEESNWAPIER